MFKLVTSFLRLVVTNQELCILAMQYITVIIIIYFRFSNSMTADMKHGAEHSKIITLTTRDVTVHIV